MIKTRTQTLYTCMIGLAIGLLWVGTVTDSHGADVSQAAGVVPDDEHRSAILEAHGYAELGENATVSQMREMAFANAKRRVLEKARTRISSQTRIENFQLQYDIVMTKAEGAVTILDEKDYRIENNRYHVWIKAEVDFSFQPKRDASNHSLMMDVTAPLTVKIWTEKKDYKIGETIQVFLQGNRDYYARVFNVSGDGSIIQLLPNRHRTSHRFEGRKLYRIPDTGDRFKLRVKPPYGPDKMVVYASEVPLGNVSMHDIGSGLQQYQGNQKSLAWDSRRGAGVEGPSDGWPEGATFYEATWEFTIQP